MTYNPSIYSASKIWHAPKWLEMRDVHGFNIIATWINYPCGSKENQTGAKLFNPEEKVQLWNDCGSQCGLADMTVVYAEEGDRMNGALVEIGGAITAKLLFPKQVKGIYIIGMCDSFRTAQDTDVAWKSHTIQVPISDYKQGYQWARDHYLWMRRARTGPLTNYMFAS